MEHRKVTIIGFGHIAHALVAGWVRTYKTLPNFIISSPHIEYSLELLEKARIKSISDNKKAVQDADIVILCVRSKIVEGVLKEVRIYLKKDALIISAAAGVTFKLLEKYLGGRQFKLIRIMPNLPVAVGEGVVGWMGNKNITPQDEKLFQKIFAKLGLLIKCKDESMLDKLTVISGCGPAYTAYFLQALGNIARKEYGFDKETALKIAGFTFAGTLKYLAAFNTQPDEFLASVATKGGITEAVIRNLDRKENFYRLFTKSISLGYGKIEKIVHKVHKV